jgi:hypothetical protein
MASFTKNINVDYIHMNTYCRVANVMFILLLGDLAMSLPGSPDTSEHDRTWPNMTEHGRTWYTT